MKRFGKLLIDAVLDVFVPYGILAVRGVQLEGWVSDLKSIQKSPVSTRKDRFEAYLQDRIENASNSIRVDMGDVEDLRTMQRRLSKRPSDENTAKTIRKWCKREIEFLSEALEEQRSIAMRSDIAVG